MAIALLAIGVLGPIVGRDGWTVLAVALSALGALVLLVAATWIMYLVIEAKRKEGSG